MTQKVENLIENSGVIFKKNGKQKQNVFQKQKKTKNRFKKKSINIHEQLYKKWPRTNKISGTFYQKNAKKSIKF